MQIRMEQLEQMSRARQQASFQRLISELRQDAPIATSHLDDTQLQAIIEQAVEKARGYGVQSSAATTTFVKIAVFAGIAFDQNPAVRQFLLAPELDPDYKVTLLAELVSKQVNDSY